MVTYKTKCVSCKKNYVEISSRQRFAVCWDCQKNELNAVIKDPKMKRLFNIPAELYQKNSFLRNIKVNYIKYGSLTDKQIEAFKKVVKDLK